MRPTITLYGDENFFLEKLKTIFEAKGFVVYVNASSGSYYNVIVHLQPKAFHWNKLVPKLAGKVLFVFSLIDDQIPKEQDIQKLLTMDTPAIIKTIYVGDIYGSDLNFLANSRFLEMTTGGSLNISPATVFYPLAINQACEFVVRELFTYAHGQDVALATKTTEEAFAARLQGLESGIPTNRTPKRSDQVIFAVPHLLSSPLDEDAMSKLAQAMKSAKPQARSVQFPAKLAKIELKVDAPTAVKNTKHKQVSPRSCPKIYKKIFIVGMVLLWLIITPFVALTFSGASLYVGAKSVEKANFTGAKMFFSVANISARLSSDFFAMSMAIPGIQTVSRSAYDAGILFAKGAGVGTRAIEVIVSGNTLVEHVLSGKNYDFELAADKFFLQVDGLYKQSMFAQGQYKNQEALFSGLVSKDLDLGESLKYVYAMRELARDMDEILGIHAPKTYLVLLQNNMELRATGGFIGSFALVTFEHGKLIDTNVFDVYSADGQLKGFVAPPEPIEKYLGEATWYMRDSNWDPDFVSSAQKAEWFLDKSLNRQVDGVVGINLEVLRTYLNTTGSIEITDFFDTVTADNFYQKIQFEVEEDFFPGSRKKAHYLTALTNEILASLTNLDQRDYLALVKNIASHFQARDIQLFLHAPQLKHMAGALGWSGELKPVCLQSRCLSLWGGLVEDNMGVNKANINIARRAQLNVTIGSDRVDYQYRVVLSNESKAVGQVPEFGYKAYVRLLADEGAQFDKVNIQRGSGSKEMFPEITKNVGGWLEAGVLVTVDPQEEVMLSYSWSVPKPEVDINRYKFFWRKQSGVLAYPFEIIITSEMPLKAANDKGSLTEGTNFHYNTALDGDIELYLITN